MKSRFLRFAGIFGVVGLSAALVVGALFVVPPLAYGQMPTAICKAFATNDPASDTTYSIEWGLCHTDNSRWGYLSDTHTPVHHYYSVDATCNTTTGCPSAVCKYRCQIVISNDDDSQSWVEGWHEWSPSTTCPFGTDLILNCGSGTVSHYVIVPQSGLGQHLNWKHQVQSWTTNGSCDLGYWSPTDAGTSASAGTPGNCP